MTQFGADPAQLRSLATQFRSEATNIGDSSNRVTNELGAAWWKGDDCDRFSNAWHGDHAKKLTDIARMLNDVAWQLDNEATAQERASY